MTGELCREMIFSDISPGAQDKCMFNNIFKFPDISGEIMGHEDLKGLAVYSGNGFPPKPVEFFNKMTDQQQDIFHTLP